MHETLWRRSRVYAAYECKRDTPAASHSNMQRHKQRDFETQLALNCIHSEGPITLRLLRITISVDFNLHRRYHGLVHLSRAG